jgi:hypothetical protein
MSKSNFSFISGPTLVVTLQFVFPVTCEVSNQFHILTLEKCVAFNTVRLVIIKTHIEISPMIFTPKHGSMIHSAMN